MRPNYQSKRDRDRDIQGTVMTKNRFHFYRSVYEGKKEKKDFKIILQRTHIVVMSGLLSNTTTNYTQQQHANIYKTDRCCLSKHIDGEIVSLAAKETETRLSSNAKFDDN